MTALEVAATPRRHKVRATLPPSSVHTICEQFRAIRAAERARSSLLREAMQRVNEGMPLPDPSIIHGTETAADGIGVDKWVFELPHNAVRPALIKEALDKIKPLAMTITEPTPNTRVITYHDEPLPLTQAEEAKRGRLLARLELSEAYFAEQQRRLDVAGAGHRSDEENAASADKLHAVERKLIRAKARTASDLIEKIELYQSDTYFSCDAQDLIDAILADTVAYLKASRGH